VGKLAILSDIHGNLPALEATLSDIAKHDIQHIVCLGDVATFGPQPKETLLKIQQLSCPVIMGNGDMELLEPQFKDYSPETEWFGDVTEWCSQQINDQDKTFIKTFQSSLEITVDNLKILAYHGSPTSFNDSISATTPDETLETYFVGSRADVYVGGHIHEQFIRRYGTRRVMNPGSVGLPFVMKGKEGFNVAVAEYAILEVIHEEPNITVRRIRYPLEELEQATQKSGMPHANHWRNWL
jgi:putative phosphoesterase